MDKRAQVIIILVVVVGIITILSTGIMGNTNNNSITNIRTIPTLPSVYTAQSNGAINTYVETFTPTPTPYTGPVNIGGAQTNVTPTLPTINCTGTCVSEWTTTQINQQIVQYLTQPQNFTNYTNLLTETEFWNGVSSILSQKMDYATPSVITFANAHVIPNDTGTYNVTQISDVWNYVEPRSVENYNYTQDEVDNGIITNNPTIWTEVHTICRSIYFQ